MSKMMLQKEDYELLNQLWTEAISFHKIVKKKTARTYIVTDPIIRSQMIDLMYSTLNC